MKIKVKKYIGLLVFLLILSSCNQKVKNLSDLGSNFYEIQHNGLRLGDSLNIYFLKNQDLVDSVELTMNGMSFQNHSIMNSSNTKLGINNLKIKVHLEDSFITGESHIPILNSVKETPIEYEVVKEYPHPAELFTQGFFFHNNRIYESAGQYGKSKLVNYALGTTQYIQEKLQDKDDFSEGIALLNGRIYQLTYRQREIFVYDESSLELKETLKLPETVKEGWGMTTNGVELIVSDGTQNIFFFDEEFRLQKKIQVAGYESVYTNLNELEFINGKIYANVWTTNFVLIINSETGAVEHYYDLAPLNQSKDSDDVLNGIAAYGNNLLVTGKNWNKIYELSVKN